MNSLLRLSLAALAAGLLAAGCGSSKPDRNPATNARALCHKVNAARDKYRLPPRDCAAIPKDAAPTDEVVRGFKLLAP